MRSAQNAQINHMNNEINGGIMMDGQAASPQRSFRHALPLARSLVLAVALLVAITAARAQSVPAWQSNHPYALAISPSTGRDLSGAAAHDLHGDPNAGGCAGLLAGHQSERRRANVPRCRRAHRTDLFQSDQHRRDPRLEGNPYPAKTAPWAATRS